MPTPKIKINRAPVLTLWATIVAERLGYDKETALTLGKAVAGLNAQSKGRRLGIYEEKSEEEKGKDAKKQKQVKVEFVELLGRGIAITKTSNGFRAVIQGEEIDSRSVEKYLKQKFGDENLPRLSRPNNWKVKHTVCMKSSARRFPRERKAGALRANWIWSTSAR
jgi:hypothetical protein